MRNAFGIIHKMNAEEWKKRRRTIESDVRRAALSSVKNKVTPEQHIRLIREVNSPRKKHLRLASLSRIVA